MKAVLILIIMAPFVAPKCSTTRADGTESNVFSSQEEVLLQIHSSDGCHADAASDEKELDDSNGDSYIMEVVENGKPDILLSESLPKDRELKFRKGKLEGCTGHIIEPVQRCSSVRVRLTPFTEVASGKYVCLVKKNGIVVRQIPFSIDSQLPIASNWTVAFYKGKKGSSSTTISARCESHWFSTTSKTIDFSPDRWPEYKGKSAAKETQLCAIFRGTFTPTSSGMYKFVGNWNTAGRLFIDGAVVIDTWENKEGSGTGFANLTENVAVSIELWYFYMSNSAGPRVNLQHTAPGGSETAQLIVKQNYDLIAPTVTYLNYRCRTLDAADPLDNTLSCQSLPLPLPSKYSIAKLGAYSRLASLAGKWGAEQILLDDGCLASGSSGGCSSPAQIKKEKIGSMTVYYPSNCAKNNKILICTDIGDNVEVIKSVRSVTFYGKKWGTIDNFPPTSSIPTVCDTRYLRIPEGWSLAPDSNVSRLVVLKYPFGSDALIVGKIALQPYTAIPVGQSPLDMKKVEDHEFYAPIVPGKKCPRILIYQNLPAGKVDEVPKPVTPSSRNRIRHEGFEYATLDNSALKGTAGCQKTSGPLPAGWSIVKSADANVLRALKQTKADFSAECVVLQDSSIVVPVTSDLVADCGSNQLFAFGFNGVQHYLPNCLSKARRILIQRKVELDPATGGSSSSTDISKTCGVCSSTGDPHFTSFGGAKFSLYTKGKQILTRGNSSWSGTAFSIEAFHVPWGSRSATVNGKISFIVGTENVTISVPVIQSSTSLASVMRNGNELSRNDFNPGDPKIRVSIFNRDNKKYILTSTLTDGSGKSGDIVINVDHSSSGVHFLNLKINLSSPIFVGKIEGICGGCGDKRAYCPRNVLFALSSSTANNHAFGECWSNGTNPPSTPPPHPCDVAPSGIASRCKTICSACDQAIANQEACLIDCCGSEPEIAQKTCQSKVIDDINDGKDKEPICENPDDFVKTKKNARGHHYGVLNPQISAGNLECALDAFSDTEFNVEYLNSSVSAGVTTYCYNAFVDTARCSQEDGCDGFKHFILQTTCPTSSFTLGRDADTGKYGVIVPVADAGASQFCVSFQGDVMDREGIVNLIVKGKSLKCGFAGIIAPDCTDEIPLPDYGTGERPSLIQPEDHRLGKATPLYRAVARCHYQHVGCVTFTRNDGKYVGVDSLTGKPCTPSASQTATDCHQLAEGTGIFVVKGRHTHHLEPLQEKDHFTDRSEDTDKAERDEYGHKCFAVGNGKSTRSLLVPHTDLDSSFHVEVSARLAKKGTDNGETKNFTATCHARLDNGELIFVGRTDFDEDEDEYHTRVIEGEGIALSNGRRFQGLEIKFHFGGRTDGKAYFSTRVKVNAGAGHIHGGNLIKNAHFGSRLSGWSPLAGSEHQHSKAEDNTDEVQENTISSKTGCLKLKGEGKNSGLSQLVEIPADRNNVDAVFFSGYSKRITEVSGTVYGGYSLYVDIAYVDGTFDYGIIAPFTPGPASSEWEYTEKLYRLKEFANGTNIPVKWVQITPLLRNFSGEAAFDNIFITVVEKCTGLPRENAFSAADPHLTTLDGHYYDVQRLGDFVLVQDSALEINVRHSRAGQAAINSIIRLNHRSGIDIVIERALDNNYPYFSVNGAPVNLNLKEKYLFGRVEVTLTGSLNADTGSFLKYEINFPSSGHQVVVTAHVSAYRKQWLQVFPRFPISSAGKTSGLLGNFNGDVSDDFTNAFGVSLPLDISTEELYTRFVDSWNSPIGYIAIEESNALDPREVLEIKTIKDFPAEQVAQVRQQCSVLTDKNLMEGCVLDVLLGEDSSFVNAFLAVPQVNVVPNPVPLFVPAQGSSGIRLAFAFWTLILSLVFYLF